MMQLRMILALFALMLAGVAQAQTFPKLTGRVVDDAALLQPAQKAALEQRLATLEQNSGRQLVVVTLPDLQGYDIADYGYRLGRAWGIGEKKANNGALLIVAPNDRKVRIEVGYGLEGILTDALSSIFIQESILPRFRENDYPGGISAGVDRIATLLTLPPEEARAQAKAAQDRAQSSGSNGGPVAFWIIVLFLFVLLPMILSAMRRNAGGQRYRGGGSSAPVILWGPGDWGGGSGGGSSWGGGGGGGFSGGGGSFGGGGASGGW